MPPNTGPTLIGVVKYAAAILTGAFGILALVVEYKAKRTGKLTRWGRVALSGIVLSTLLSLVSQRLDDNKAHRDAEAASSDRARLLDELIRTQNPIRDVVIGYRVVIPTDDALAAYRNRLKESAKAFAANPTTFNLAPNATANVAFYGPDQKASVVAIPALSPLLPELASEPLAFMIFRYSGVDIALYAANRSAEVNSSTVGPPDLTWGGIIGPQTGFPGFPQTEYGLASDIVVVAAFGMPLNPQFWMSTGKIIAITDLLGSEMQVRLPRVALVGNPPWSKDYERIHAGMTLGELHLTIASQEFLFPATAFQRREDRAGHFFYRFKFPDKLEGLKTLRVTNR